MPELIPMSPQRREMFLRIMDGVDSKQLGHLLHHLNDYVHCDRMLKFLIDHDFTGKKLVEVLAIQGWSKLNVAKWIIKEVNKESSFKPIIVGRDYRVR